MQSISTPILTLEPAASSSLLTRDEGGALQVNDVVAAAQQAYETRLLTLVTDQIQQQEVAAEQIASKPRPRAVEAELARAVVFETVAFRPRAERDAGSKVIEMNSSEESKAAVSTNDDLPSSPVTATTVGYRTPQSTAKQSDQAAGSGSPQAQPDELGELPALLVPRLENDEAASEMAFSKWPLLATAVVAYLATEHSPAVFERFVQTPPSRRRHERKSNDASE